MKKLFLVILVIIPCVTFLYAQENNFDKLRIITQIESNAVKLRWMPTDHATWVEGNTTGYTITRYTTFENGVQLSFADVQASLITIASNILPLQEAQWDNDFTDNPFAQVAKGALYEEDVSIVISGSPSLADAYNKVASEDTRFVFGLFAAEQDFAVAEAMAVGIEDSNINANTTYLYRVTLDSSNPDFQNISTGTIVNTNEITVLPIIETPYGQGEDKAIILQWDMIENSENYATYDVEKSIDGITYEKANPLPFVFAAEGVENPKVAVYKDEVADNTTLYYYRVRGRTPFGTQGPPSASVKLKGMPPRVNIYPVLSDYMEDDQAGVRLLWNTFEAALQSQITGFNIYRSQQSNKNFVKINTSPIDASATFFNDAQPFSATYYQLEVVDINGYTYTSPSLLVQLKDEEPPAVPVGLSGRFLTSTTLELTWDQNTEEDLKGYRLFIANKETSVFVQITSNAVKDNRYVYEVNTQFSVADIWIKILATDFRDNYSAKSEAIAVARPDVIPPSKPVLYKAIPTPAGIEFGFKFSTSEDRKEHVLQYKAEDTPNWAVALAITKENESNYLNNLTPNAITSTHYILPNQNLERRPYQFRMIAEDESGNKSSSQILTIRPYHSGKRGEIENLEVSFDLTELITPPLPSHVILDEIIDIYESSIPPQIDYHKFEQIYILGLVPEDKYNQLMAIFLPFPRGIQIHGYLVELRGTFAVPPIRYAVELTMDWTYTSTDQLEDFQIFRSAEGGTMMLYETLPITTPTPDTPYEFVDTDLKYGYRYFYQVMARHAGGGFSPRSAVKMVKVE